MIDYEPCYAIGIEHKPNSFGMTHGPTPVLQEMLDVHGEENAAIIFFDIDGTDRVLYRWRDEQWKEEKPQ